MNALSNVPHAKREYLRQEFIELKKKEQEKLKKIVLGICTLLGFSYIASKIKSWWEAPQKIGPKIGPSIILRR